MVKILQKGLVCFLVACTLLADPALSGRPEGHAPPQRSAGPSLSLPPAFPLDDYTPHGYIDNPYHSMVANRSGVIRTFPPLGFGWWRTEATAGGYGYGDRDHLNYLSLLQLSAAIGDTVFLAESDFARYGSPLRSAYHTKHVLSYDWQVNAVTFSVRCFLAREHALACYVEVANEGAIQREVSVHATHIYRIGSTKWWGSDGLTSRYVPHLTASISKVWAYGDVFALAGSVPCTAFMSTDSAEARERWIRTKDTSLVKGSSLQGSGPLWSVQRFLLRIPAHEHRGMWVMLCRGKSESSALEELRHACAGAEQELGEQLAEDQEFWASCPVLTGDWPDAWRRGWVYDFETLRMTVRRPLGIFKHPWDAMQVHSPRVVLGETSLDMMTLGYASPSLAREVLYGTFADAVAPNIPCAREDGSVNMISADGSECGTAPMWGYPFHVVRSLFAASQDTGWLAGLYPHLSDYLHWWLKHRTDSEGWLHCNNSWESGQDGSRRFLVAEHNEGAVADFVRTVDVESSMAEGLAAMGSFAEALGKGAEASDWKRLASRRVQNTHSMFRDGWFYDVDGRDGRPIDLHGYFDVMMLAPVACGVATEDQRQALRAKFGYFLAHPTPSLEWPPLLFTFTEAAWRAGERESASLAVAGAADRTYLRTDSRNVSRRNEDDPFSYRVPGVANEYWPVKDIPPGCENYGWGATLPMFIIRNIIGFRETESSAADSFFVAPYVPSSLMRQGRTYGITNLKFGGVIFSMEITCRADRQLTISLHPRAHGPFSLRVVERETGRVVASAKSTKGVSPTWKGVNGTVYTIQNLGR
jgi:hypothetical protein